MKDTPKEQEQETRLTGESTGVGAETQQTSLSVGTTSETEVIPEEDEQATVANTQTPTQSPADTTNRLSVTPAPEDSNPFEIKGYTSEQKEAASLQVRNANRGLLVGAVLSLVASGLIIGLGVATGGLGLFAAVGIGLTAISVLQLGGKSIGSSGYWLSKGKRKYLKEYQLITLKNQRTKRMANREKVVSKMLNNVNIALDTGVITKLEAKLDVVSLEGKEKIERAKEIARGQLEGSSARRALKELEAAEEYLAKKESKSEIGSQVLNKFLIDRVKDRVKRAEVRLLVATSSLLHESSSGIMQTQEAAKRMGSGKSTIERAYSENQNKQQAPERGMPKRKNTTRGIRNA